MLSSAQQYHTLALLISYALWGSSEAVPRRQEPPTALSPSCPTCHGHGLHGPAPAAEPLKWLAAVPLTAQTPTSGVNISSNPLLLSVMESNIDYLLSSFDLDHMLFPFRLRNGDPSPPPGSRPQVPMWDVDLQGANAGRFMMGAGNTLRWVHNPSLQRMLDELVDGVEACKDNTTGYSLAYEPAGLLHFEQGDYARSWFTQGLIEAGKSGNQQSFKLLRELYDWFNDPTTNTVQPYLYAGVGNGEQGHIASTRVALETPVGAYKDAQVASNIYRDELWLQQLINRDTAAISRYHMPRPNHPHCYEMTAFLAFFDQYRATGNQTYLRAVQGAMQLLRDNYVQLDGTSALTESYPDPYEPTNKPKAYRILPGANNGETCCTSFWVKFLQRFQLLQPDEAWYAEQIENTLYNGLLRAQVPRTDPAAAPGTTEAPGIRYHNAMGGAPEEAPSKSTCCEGQGTRMFGSLPEYIYSLAPRAKAVYINMFAASSIEFAASTSMKASASVAPSAARTRSIEQTLKWKLITKQGYQPGNHCADHQILTPPCPTGVSTLEQCKALCEASTPATFNACMGISWTETPGVLGFTSRCTTFQSIDFSSIAKPTLPGDPPVNSTGVESWLLLGRRVAVQDDRVPGHPGPATVPDDTTPAALRVRTGYPFDQDVSIQVTVKQPLNYSIKLRIPSWLPSSVSVSLNGQPRYTGTPGSYLDVQRLWHNSDELSLSLPSVYRLIVYDGVDQIPVGTTQRQRFALLVGPLVLACVGPTVQNSTSTIVIPHAPINGSIADWLIPIPDKKLHFGIRGLDSRFEFMPNWEVRTGQQWTTYPLYIPK